MFLEVCANSVESAIAAEKGGANRVELCDNLSEGGTTPSFGAIRIARKHLSIDLHVIIRPRGGDFLYNSLELEIMKSDILECRKIGVDGVVFGMLTQDGKIDKNLCQHFVDLAFPMKTTFHRAFDMVSDPFLSLDDIISSGFDILLTSGLQNKAINGIQLIKELVVQSNERISIMPGSGINETNVLEIAKKTLAKNFHISVRKISESKMIFKNENLKMGGIQQISEFEKSITDETKVKLIKDILETISY